MEIRDFKYSAPLNKAKSAQQTMPPPSELADVLKTRKGAAGRSTSNAITGMTMNRLAPETAEAAIHAGQSVETRGLSQFESLNQLSKSDRDLLGAMTGWTVGNDMIFRNQNGKQGFPEGLNSHSLRNFMMGLDGARRTGVITGDVTQSQFKELIKQARANTSGMGEVFNEELEKNGLKYFENKGGSLS